jgi:hypothetical protein
MRKPGYYWAVYQGRSKPEIVSIYTDERADYNTVCRVDYSGVYKEDQFDWIDDEPIPVKMRPVPLVKGAYYVIDTLSPANETILVRFTGNIFKDFYGCAYGVTPDRKIVSGPFTELELQERLK